MLRTIWGDNERYLSTYWEKFQNRYYVAGDSAHRDKDGYFWIMGRIDDVLNVAGHRLGDDGDRVGAGVASARGRSRGRRPAARREGRIGVCVRRAAAASGRRATFRTLVDELRKWVSQELGAIARPDDIRFADNLPKTRSGKIMRRLLRSVARGDEITQTSPPWKTVHPRPAPRRRPRSHRESAGAEAHRFPREAGWCSKEGGEEARPRRRRPKSCGGEEGADPQTCCEGRPLFGARQRR